MEFDLDRFVLAQAECYSQVVKELEAGKKRTHWMWFIFPQIAGLGSSETSRRFAIRSLDEAKAYSQHPILGQRLIRCTMLVNAINGRTIEEIFGPPDDLKFCSSMTLFRHASNDPKPFANAIQKYFDGIDDAKTLALMSS